MISPVYTGYTSYILILSNKTLQFCVQNLEQLYIYIFIIL